jgi:hypothetical protein
MRSPLCRFALIAVAGLTAFALAQTPVHAQFYPLVRPVPPPVPIRRPIVVPPANQFVNPYILPRMTLNQFATLSVLSQSGTLPPWIYGYYNPYRSLYSVSPYPVAGYPTATYATQVSVPGVPYNPYNFYNPFFASFGLYP